MLATVAALQLVLLAQAPAPPLPRGAAEEERAPEPDAPPADEADAGAAAETDVPPPPRVARPGPRQQSLLSAQPLRGGSAALGWAGWPELGALYAIGLTERDDLGVYATYDWAKSESRIGFLYRRPLARAGPFDTAARVSLAWYVNNGADYFYEDNRSDRGFEVVPGLALSRAAAGGIFSALAEGPMTVTGKYDTGFLFSPRAALAFETPLYPTLTVGVRLGAGYRAGAGDAPLREGRGELQFLVLAGYQLL